MKETAKWDQILIKKYNNTSHSRLLNQLKTEVKAYPLKRKAKENKIVEKPINKATDNTYNNTNQKETNSFKNNFSANSYKPIYKSNHKDTNLNNNLAVSQNGKQEYNQTNGIEHDYIKSNNQIEYSTFSNFQEKEIASQDKNLVKETEKRSFLDRLQNIDMR